MTQVTFTEALIEIRDDLIAGRIEDFNMYVPSKCIGGIMRQRHPHLFPPLPGFRNGLLANSEGVSLFYFYGTDLSKPGRASQIAEQHLAIQAINNYLNGETKAPWRGVL